MRNPGIVKKKQPLVKKGLKARDLGHLDKTDAVITLYVSNLSYQKNEYDIRRIFNRFGKVNYLRILYDRKTKKSKGVAFVQMPYKKDAERAIEGLNGQNIEGRILKVSIAKDNQKVKTVKVKSQEFHLDEEPRKTIKIPMKRKKEKGLKVLLKYLNKS